MFMKHADSCSEHNKYQMKWVLFLSTFNFNIWYVPLFQRLHQHISGIVSIYFLRTSTLMPSATQAKGFPLNVQQIGPVYFLTRPKFARWGWGLYFEVFSPSFSVFRQIPSIASSSDNSLFYGCCNGQFNKNNGNLLNMQNVLIILSTAVYISPRRTQHSPVSYREWRMLSECQIFFHTNQMTGKEQNN